MKKRKPTIKDIARKLDISVSTVSRAIRGAEDINPVTKRKVLELAEKIGYKKSVLAAGLASKKSFLIGVIIPELTVPFFGTAILGIEEFLKPLGYDLIILHSDENAQNESDCIDLLIDRQVDGILISLSMNTTNDDHLRRAMEEEIPLVVFDRILPNSELPIPRVIVDDFDAGFQATQHLINKGYKRVAFITGPVDMYISQKRQEGYVRAMERNGRPTSAEYIVPATDLRRSVGTALDKLMVLKDKPDAIIAFNDPIAFKVISLLHKRGVKIPTQIAVMGISGDAMGELFYPSLTTINQPAKEMGFVAANLLIDRVTAMKKAKDEGKLFIPMSILKTLPIELIEREST
ncbi:MULTISPECIES: LacI family DNA-binding transcriptional regulator [Flammeovirga]|uniref:LacI family transcriptional regulator n=1 Tax=Flammeovirga agarivorans TaxID=2726742 RepID=A0A7X8XY99_9BACT|nr:MULTISPECIES: LacI family DNA-binding transcriptional regulator [Flammeovirga]NLR94009.1 LacI family transcriptional regulator [Flammeovirga agarivorans]